MFTKQSAMIGMANIDVSGNIYSINSSQLLINVRGSINYNIIKNLVWCENGNAISLVSIYKAACRLSLGESRFVCNPKHSTFVPHMVMEDMVDMVDMAKYFLTRTFFYQHPARR